MEKKAHEEMRMKQRALWHDYRKRGIYMLTLVVDNREPLLGRLVGDWQDATGKNPVRIERSPMGRKVAAELEGLVRFFPMVKIIRKVVMPNHVHVILVVTEDMEKHLGGVVRGFKAGCTKELKERVALAVWGVKSPLVLMGNEGADNRSGQDARGNENRSAQVTRGEESNHEPNNTGRIDAMAECDDFEHDVCAVREQSYFYCFSEEIYGEYSKAASIGKAEELVGAPYFNSGVMYVKDTPIAHNLYDEWHKKWNECRALGKPTDQVPLGLANKELGGVIAHVADKWNCQVMCQGIWYSINAKIIHYYYSLGDISYPLSSDAVYEEIRKHDKLSPYVLGVLNSPKKSLVSMESVSLLKDLESFARLQKMCPDMFETMRKSADLYIQERKKGEKIKQKMLSIIVVKCGREDGSEKRKFRCLINDGVEVLKAKGFADVPDVLAQAEGRYVKVVSDEDWMDEVLLQECVDRLRGEYADLVICDYYMQNKSGEDKLVTMNSMNDYQRVNIPRGVAAPKTRFILFPPETIIYKTEMLKRLAGELHSRSLGTAQEWEFYPLFDVEDIAYYKISFCHCDADDGGERMSVEQILNKMEQRIAIADRMLKYYVERDHVLISAGTQLMIWSRLENLFFSLMNMLMSMRGNARAMAMLERLSRKNLN